MKKFVKFFIIILMLALNFFANVYAADLGITSAIYDDSTSMLTINTMDSNNYEFTVTPKLYILKEENKAYFDINSAVLKFKAKNFIISSPEIDEIHISQFSTNPNIVRVVMYYEEGYNPENIQLKKINSTLFVNFKNTTISNYYFQQIYGNSKDTGFYEPTVIQYPASTQLVNNTIKIISNNDNLPLERQDLTLVTKYYADNIKINSSTAILNGFGNVNISNPIYLSEPTRVAYDIANTYVNPNLRNKEISLTSTEKIKIGQFNRNTARVVVTGTNAQKYIPIINSDNQKITFVNKESYNPQLLYGYKTDLNNIVYGKANSELKFIFSKPVVYGIEKTPSSIDLLLLNVQKYNDTALKSATKNSNFSDVNFWQYGKGGIIVSLPTNKTKETDIHFGSDGKTIRIKQTQLKKAEVKPNKKDTTTQKPKITLPSITKTSNKKSIVIDPGHGGTDCGATRNGIYEKDIALDVSKRVVKLLKNMGYNVEITRDTDIYVSLQDRVEYSEAVSPDIFVSIHVNSSNSDTPYGLETHYYKDNSLQLAKTVHASMLNHINSKDRGLFKSKFYVINHTTAPAILVEMGFISNAQERAQLVTESRKQATAKAIAEGINDYFKQEY